MILKAKSKSKSDILNGLVLAGGKSSRMGMDKSTLIWHDKEQHYHMVDLLEQFCSAVFISCRPGQQEQPSAGYKILTDTIIDLGPYGAILSAFEKNAECAWLVTACDLPLLDKFTIQYLVNHRDPSCIATTFKSPYDGLPEPLITIWESHSYPVLLSFLNEGISCPRKALINSDVCVLNPPDPMALTNVNTPGDAAKTRDLIKKKVYNA